MADSPHLPDLLRLANEAKRRALAAGRPVVATAAARCPPFDPLAVLGRAGSRRRLFWQRPGDGFTLVGIGCDREIAVSGPDRFQTAKTALAALLSQTVCDFSGVPLSLPIAFAGFAFSPDSAQPGPFPRGLVLVPRLLLIADRGDFWVSASLAVTPETSVEESVARVESDIASLLSPLASPGPPATHCGVEFDDQRDYSAWERSVLGVLDQIGAGTVEKVVLARAVQALSDSPLPPGPLLARLARRYPQAAVFAFASGDSCFLGASPERLVKMSPARSVTVDCLAGSIARSDDPATDLALADALLSDPKERHEHEVVLRALKEGLSGVCERVQAPATPVIRSTATVQHLHTPITASAAGGLHVLDLVEKLHPTPATGGYPRDAALRIIREQEIVDRGWYAGPVGWIGAEGDGEFAVAIRSGLIEDKTVTLYAGSGIVSGSDPRREYEETRLKLGTMMWALKSE